MKNSKLFICILFMLLVSCAAFAGTDEINVFLKKSIDGKEVNEFIVFKLTISKPTDKSGVQWFLNVLNIDAEKVNKVTYISSATSSFLDEYGTALVKDIEWESGKRIAGLLTVFGGEVYFKAIRENDKWVVSGSGNIKQCEACKKQELLIKSIDSINIKYRRMKLL